jgi:exopolysaccharide/PEP-CTERM locus tyrosine autokinase
MFEDQPKIDESTVDKDKALEDSELNLNLSHPETVEERHEDKQTKIDIPEENKVIPITKRKEIETDDRDDTDIKGRTVSHPPEVAIENYKSAQIDPNLVALLRPDSFEAEQFRMLRSNLMFPLEGKPPRIILVTGAVPGEGKSFIAANLAITFAMDIQTHVLLIDCDIRNPHVHKRFGYQSVIGLSEYLTGKMDISSMLLNTNVNKLKILPGGKPPKNPSELLSSRRMSNLLKEVKEKYPDRYIILDSPPPKLTAETNVLSRQVDGILLVAKYGRTRREDLVELIGKLGKDKIVGVIINWFNLRASRYYGYGKYGGYKNYYGKKG